MKKIFIIALMIAQVCAAFTQNCCENDSIVIEPRFPLTEQDTKTTYIYLNDKWCQVLSWVPADSIQKAEVKNDEYGNRAMFLTVSPETEAEYDAKVRANWVEYPYPRCEFPGGDAKLKEWLDENIKVPEGYKGSERVVVSVKVHPDGSISNPKIMRASKNEAANREALRLVNALPNFRVKYYAPKKCSFNYIIPIRFTEPGMIFIRGGENSFINQFPEIETKIKQLYENMVFGTAKDPAFKISDICTADFLKRLAAANDYDTEGYATWLLRSGMQDGDDSPSKVLSIVPGKDNTVVVKWIDMGHKGSTTFTLTETDGVWKINDATVPEGYNPL